MLGPHAGKREAAPQHRRVARRAREDLVGLGRVDALALEQRAGLAHGRHRRRPRSGCCRASPPARRRAPPTCSTRLPIASSSGRQRSKTSGSPADHDRERRRLGSGRAAADRRVEEVDALLGQRTGQPPRERRRARRHVDHDRARAVRPRSSPPGRARPPRRRPETAATGSTTSASGGRGGRRRRRGECRGRRRAGCRVAGDELVPGGDEVREPSAQPIVPRPTNATRLMGASIAMRRAPSVRMAAIGATSPTRRGFASSEFVGRYGVPTSPVSPSPSSSACTTRSRSTTAWRPAERPSTLRRSTTSSPPPPAD